MVKFKKDEPLYSLVNGLRCVAYRAAEKAYVTRSLQGRDQIAKDIASVRYDLDRLEKELNRR